MKYIRIQVDLIRNRKRGFGHFVGPSACHEELVSIGHYELRSATTSVAQTSKSF